MDELKWLEQWYFSQCDGDWEHMYSIKIGNIDNPGWSIVIELKDTGAELIDSKNQLVEFSEDDWYEYKVENATFFGFGSPLRLGTLISIFKNIIEGSSEIHDGEA